MVYVSCSTCSNGVQILPLSTIVLHRFTTLRSHDARINNTHNSYDYMIILVKYICVHIGNSQKKSGRQNLMSQKYVRFEWTVP